jgi:hypothetical protein
MRNTIYTVDDGASFVLGKFFIKDFGYEWLIVP